jgi:hypothetical protein
MILDRQDIYYTLNITSGSFLGYLNLAGFSEPHTSNTLLQRTRRKNMMRVYLLLVCLLPLLMCQANAAPRSWSESSSWREESHFNGKTIQTRQGWPLLTVETEANGDSRSTYKRDPSLVGLLGSVVPVQEIFVLPWLLNIFFFLTVHYFTLFVLFAQNAGHTVLPCRLSLKMCLWLIQ